MRKNIYGYCQWYSAAKTWTNKSQRTASQRRYLGRLDRLGRSLKDLIDWINYLDTEGVALKSLQESIDTSTATGKLVFHVFGALAEFERNLILERTQAGLSAARARGILGGRPKSLDADKKQVVIDLYNEKKLTVKKICEMMGISKPTLYDYVRDYVPKPKK